MIKKILVGLGLLVVVAGAAAFMFVRGILGLDDWIVRQVIAIQSTYIVPTMEFESFDYQAPKTVVFDGLTLTALDGTRVVDCRQLTLTLAKVPSRGEPLVIERIELTDPKLRLVRDTSAESVSFNGLLPFVKRSNIANQEQVSEEVRLSSVLQIRRLAMTGGGLFYDVGDGSPPMEIDGIAFGMDIEPAEGSDEPGWYALDMALNEASLLDLSVAGRFNLDTFDAQIDALALETSLDDESYSVLPPQIQLVLRERDARGAIRVDVSGFASVRDLASSNLEMGIGLQGFNIAAGEYRLPVDEAQVKAQLVDGVVNVTNCQTALLNGRFDLTGASIDLMSEARQAQLAWEAENLDLQELLRTKTSEGEPPLVAGILATHGQAEMDTASGLESIAGLGEVHIVEGRLIASPSLKALMNVMDIVGQIRGDVGLNDTADLIFDLTPAGIEFSKIEVHTSAVMARGDGLITWDQQMDLEVNAGPLAKLQSKLGQVGKIFGQITDSLITYEVKGPLGEPTVRAKPLGL